ncbi:MAG: tetratricopeptide repeat protein [Candidatus Kuenenbacteria bacterium]
MRDSDRAVEILEDGWQNNPDNRNYVVELVNYLISVDKKDKAGTVIDKWLKAHPEDFSMKAKLN